MAVTHSLSLVSASSQYAISSDADNLSVSNTGKISIGFWVNPTTLNNNNYAIWKGTSSNYEYQIVAGDANGAINVAFFSLAGNVRYNIVTVNNTIPINLWSNVFITLDDSVAHSINNLKIYVNGEPAVTGSSSSNSANLLGNGSAPLNVGRRQDTTVYFNGKISNIQVYNTVLSQSDIRSVINYFVTSHANIVACWTLNNVYTDLIGSNTLTASGSPVFSTTYPDAINLTENGAFTKKHKIVVQASQVPGSTDLTDVPIVLTESNFFSSVFDNTQGQEINTNALKSDSSLKAYYRFNTGALTTDSSGNSNTLTNNNTVGETTGKFGGGADQGSANSTKYFSITNDVGVGGTTSLTVSLWIKLNDEITSGTQTICTHVSNSGADRYFELYYDYNSGTRRLRLDPSNNAVTTAIINVTLGTSLWHHIVLVRDVSAGTSRIYHNAIAGPTQANGTTGGGNTNRFSIGASPTGVGDTSAIYDDVSVFNRALSAEEVRSLYAGGQDLRFSTDIAGKTRLAHEVVSWDTAAKTGEVWVKANTLGATTNTPIYVHYKNPTASALDENEAFGKHQVYPSAYQAVWHYSNIPDSTKNSYDGTNTAVTFLTANGKIKEGADFNGSANILHSAKIMPQGAKTVMYWFRKASNPASTRWIMANLANSTTQYGIDVAFTATGTNAFSLGRASATTNFTLTSSVLTDNTWNLIAVTWDGTTGSNGAKMYLNGTVNDQKTAAVTETNAPTSNLRIGALSDNAGPFTGQLDNVVILNKVLTADEIQTLYNNQNNPATFAIPQSTAGGAFLLQFV